MKPAKTTGTDVFFQEWLATGQAPNQLSISATCNARCLFCSNDQNPFPIHRNVFRDVNDIRWQLSLLPSHYRDEIMLSESLPGRISEGEAFLHPQFFEILELIRRKFPTNKLCFTTNASLLDEAFVAKLAGFRPMEINVSMHSANPGNWAKIFQTPVRKAETAIRSLSLLKRAGIPFTGTIVPMPAVTGWPELESTFDFLVEAGASSVILWWAGYTDKTSLPLKRLLACSWQDFVRFGRRMQERHPEIKIYPMPDITAPRQLPIRRIMHLTRKGNIKSGGGAFRNVMWLTSEKAHPEIAKAVKRATKEFPNRHLVVSVKNTTYGGNISVSGLLMVSDFADAARQALIRYPETDLLLIPRTPFDSFLRDLTGVPAFTLAEAIGRPIWVVSETGTCQVLQGLSFIPPEMAVRSPLEQVMNRFLGLLEDGNMAELLHLVAAFPIPTSSGILKKSACAAFLLEHRNRLLAGKANPGGWQFERLDHCRVLCRQECSVADPSDVHYNWFHLRKVYHAWRIEMVLLGETCLDLPT